MTIAEQIVQIATNARLASHAMAKLSSESKDRLLLAMADALVAASAAIIAENKKDLAAGE